MRVNKQHLILYDGTCGLCHRAVQFILRYDTNRIFVFAPLQGETADEMLKNTSYSFENMDTLVLIEKYSDKQHRQFFTFGKGALRICWLLGGWWTIPGILSFLPSFLYNWSYRWVARRRFDWFPKEECLIPTAKDTDRFLP